MTDPLVPNFNPGVGRLATDRFDFQDHIDGYDFRHNATSIDLIPAVSIVTPKSNVYDAIVALRDALTVPIVPDATTVSKGIIQLSGDIGGTATSVDVLAIRGFPIAATPPTLNYVLTWNGSVWSPAPVSSGFVFAGDVTGNASATVVEKINGKPVSAAAPALNNLLVWSGTEWVPSTITAGLSLYGGGPNWADGTTNPATTAEAQFDKIVSDLSATTGDVKVGAPARAGAIVSLLAGSVGTQMSALLSALNAFELQKAAANGLASLNASIKLTEAQRSGWIVYTGAGNGPLDGYSYDGYITSTTYVDSMYLGSPIQVQFSSICNNGDVVMVDAHVRCQRFDDGYASMFARVGLIDGASPIATIGYEEELKGDSSSPFAPGEMVHIVGRAILSNVGTNGTATVKIQFKVNNAAYPGISLGPAWIQATLIRP